MGPPRADCEHDNEQDEDYPTNMASTHVHARSPCAFVCGRWCGLVDVCVCVCFGGGGGGGIYV